MRFVFDCKSSASTDLFILLIQWSFNFLPILDPANRERIVRSLPHLLQRAIRLGSLGLLRSRASTVSGVKAVVLPGAILAAIFTLLRFMSLRQELISWLYLPRLEVSSVPQPGDKAPSTAQLALPCGDGRPAVIVFLRHCGCPCKCA